MKTKFFTKAAFLFLLILLTSLAIALIPNISTYMGAFIDKQKILKTVKSPKLILVGGSNLAFGLDSSLLEKAVGLPVVNTGLHGGLGLKFMLDHVSSYIQPDDLVIVAPEYEILAGLPVDYGVWWMTILSDFPYGVRYFSPKDYIQALHDFPNFAYSKLFLRTTYFLKGIPLPIDNDYRRDGFDKNGDKVDHLGKPSMDLSKVESEVLFGILALDINDGVKMLNEFSSYVNSRGGKVLFTFAPISSVRYQNSKSKIESAYHKLRSDLKMPILGTPADYVFPLTFFYDTAFHLNATGRLARTEKVIADLRKFQQLQINAGK